MEFCTIRDIPQQTFINAANGKSTHPLPQILTVHLYHNGHTNAVSYTESLMRHSNATYLEVLTAQQSLLEAEVQQLQTRFERIQSVIKLYHVLGGGM